MTALYSVGTWDEKAQAFTPQCLMSVPAFNITHTQLFTAIRELRLIGYTAHRIRAPDGSHEENDPMVLIKRTDGKHWKEIRQDWNR